LKARYTSTQKMMAQS